ncbi:MAG: Crp/Fnr family transcriptional regulator [Spirochaetales bacterium]|nr:Crp/Fnr family transcriptional regulator [Leptospiraceae bacterium]MCP5479810.1 Crp/Fnr family transcriptional regulator [Spirochaetales bacterium]MCP5486200.1 Crp/Fnr family transcriptional regulator [Spirochaetales bacterium]
MMLPESLFEKFGVEFEPGEIIFCEWEPGEECFFIQDGRVKITKTVGNTQKTLDVIGAGDFFGEMAILEAEPRSASAVAVDHVRALKFNRENFGALMNSQPPLAFRLLVIFANRIYDARRRLQILLLDDNQAKVSDVFLMLSEKDPHYGHSAQMVFNVTVDDVASWCGLPAPEVQRVISGFVKQGKLELFADRIVIKNINDFSRLVAAKRKNLAG